jgi:hypothetical protein
MPNGNGNGNDNGAIKKLQKAWGLPDESPSDVQARQKMAKQIKEPSITELGSMIGNGRGNGKSNGRQASPRGGNGK